ncbi:uncharacterized protein ACIB01_002460 isoform 2-T2 [Guaruba guarouba]
MCWREEEDTASTAHPTLHTSTGAAALPWRPGTSPAPQHCCLHHVSPQPHRGRCGSAGRAPHLGLWCWQLVDGFEGTLGRGGGSAALTGTVWLDVHPNSPHRCHGAPRPHPGAAGTALQDTGTCSLTLCTHQRAGPVLPGCQSPSAGPGAPMQCPGPLARCCSSLWVSAALLLLLACSHLPRVYRVCRSSASLVINMMMMMIITLIFCFAFVCHASGGAVPGP